MCPHGGREALRRAGLSPAAETCYPRESDGISFDRRWFVCGCMSVCLSVTTITKKIVDEFVPNLWQRS